MHINGFTSLMVMLAFVGIAVFGTIALRAYVYRQACANLERCFSEAAHQNRHPNIPAISLRVMMTLRTPALRDALTRAHWMSTLSAVAWGAIVLDTTAPDLRLSDPRLRRWYRGILADAQRQVPRKVRQAARRFAADPFSDDPSNHPDSWLPNYMAQGAQADLRLRSLAGVCTECGGDTSLPWATGPDDPVWRGSDGRCHRVPGAPAQAAEPLPPAAELTADNQAVLDLWSGAGLSAAETEAMRRVLAAQQDEVPS